MYNLRFTIGIIVLLVLMATCVRYVDARLIDQPNLPPHMEILGAMWLFRIDKACYLYTETKNENATLKQVECPKPI